ncbi:SLAP domain-containing protein [uncultured Lactobacillus sp.]|uniref:SLAP domain-containing protein n=1 Tax=uncultured Lactobacillus sp. TaxID=153152 RepID=UPI002803ADAA|nr:SLAP domain-containing protein [uncultured Lactobacillus sp.]
MLKRKIIYLAGLAMVAAGLGVATNNQVANAAVTNPIRQGNKLNLTRSTYVYDRNGMRIGRLKKGNKCKIHVIKVINGNTYVKIGKNKFVKQEAFLPYIKSAVRVENVIKKTSYLYDENGEKIPGKFIKRGTKVDYLGHKEINEKPFIKIGDGEYVKAFNVLTIMITD